MAEEKTPEEKEATREIRKPVERPRWLIPLVTIVIVIFILWYFSRSCGETKPNTTALPDTTTQVHKGDTSKVIVHERPDSADQ
ncbi:MAG: hypothetical protein ACTHNG_16085 [Ginsengibacter sp.]